MTEEETTADEKVRAKVERARGANTDSEPFMTAMQLVVQARFPVFLWGMPGSGKTVNTEILGKALSEPLWTVILSIREPTDQGGLPKITDKGVKLVPPRWAYELDEHKHGIVFFDEFNTTEARIQASALRVVHEGYAGDLKLPKDTSFIAAGNRPETSPGAIPLMSAMANRFVHIDWIPSVSRWVTGMISGFPTPEVVRLPSTWKQRIPAKQALIGEYIRQNPEALESEPEDRFDAGRAWPSRRTWRMASHLAAAAEAAGFGIKHPVTTTLIKGCVGDGAYKEFGQYISEMDLRDPEEYLADPMGTPIPKTQDKIYVTASAVVSAALDNQFKVKARERRQRAAWKVLKRMGELRGDDMMIPRVRVLASNMEPSLFNEMPEEIFHFDKIMDLSKVDYSKAG